MVKAYHLHKPQSRRTIKSQDHSITIFLDDNQRLLIKAKSAQHPFPLTAVDTLALANLLITEYKTISQEAKKYNGPKDPGRKDEWI